MDDEMNKRSVLFQDYTPIILICVGIIGIIIFLTLSGCETSVDEDWEGFGAGAGIHPFVAPYEDNHDQYLEEELYPLSDCQVCHGADYAGGTSGVSCLTCHTDPGGPEACGTCHAMPPADPHPQLNSCFYCHDEVVNANNVIIDEELHINGSVEYEVGDHHPFAEPYQDNHPVYLRTNLFPLEDCQACHGTDFSGGLSEESCLDCHTYPGGPEACNTCHGNFSADPEIHSNQAPPPDVVGNTSTGLVTVGAHTSHLEGVQYTDGIRCIDCHLVILSWNTSGHIDPSPAEVPFDGIAVQGGATPVWNRTSETCSGTYCHGDAVPQWTIVNGTQAACGSCHGIPPPEPHFTWPTLEECSVCHGQVIDDTGTIIAHDLHLNGEVTY